MQKTRKIFSDTVIYSIGNIVNRFIAFLLLPVYTHYFVPDEFGAYSIIYSFWFFISVIYLYGMETAVQKFYLDEKNNDTRKKIYSSTFILIFTTSVLLSIFLFLSADKVSIVLLNDPSYAHIIKMVAVILIIDTLSRFPMIVINSLQLSKIYTLINITTVIINITANIYMIVFLNYGIEAIFYSFLISYSYQLIISLIYTAKYFGRGIDISIVKNLLKYSHYFIYYGVFIISMDLFDRFFLGMIKGNDAAGIYTASYRLALVMNLLISGFRTAWFPFFMDLKDDKENKKIFSEIFTYFNFFGMLFFLVISLFAAEFVKINIGNYYLLDPQYWDGLSIIPLILLSYFFFGLYTNLIIVSFYKDKIKFLLISSGVAAIVNITLNLILIPFLSFNGAAIATMISYLIMFLIIYYLSQQTFYIKYEWKKILFIWFVCIIFVTAGLILSAIEISYYLLLTYKIISLIAYLIILYKNNFFKLLNLSKSEVLL